MFVFYLCGIWTILPVNRTKESEGEERKNQQNNDEKETFIKNSFHLNNKWTRYGTPWYRIAPHTCVIIINDKWSWKSIFPWNGLAGCLNGWLYGRLVGSLNENGRQPCTIHPPCPASWLTGCLLAFCVLSHLVYVCWCVCVHCAFMYVWCWFNLIHALLIWLQIHGILHIVCDSAQCAC